MPLDSVCHVGGGTSCSCVCVCVMAIHSSTSDTTRQPRSGEVNGRGLCTIAVLYFALCLCVHVCLLQMCILNAVQSIL